MKKTFALLLVIVLALSLSITAFAVPTSGSGVTISSSSGSATTSAFETPSEYSGNVSAAVADAKSASGYSSSSLNEIAAFDITCAPGTSVTLTVPGFAGKYVVLMHYITGTGSWVKEYAGDTDATTGSFTFTLGSNSPFVLFTYTPSSYIGGGSNVTAPKTADTTPIALLTGLAVMSVLGCAYCIKRSRA